MPIAQRLRQLAPGLIGLAIAGSVLWRGGAALEREAQTSEAFALRVADPARVLAASAPAQTMQWRGVVTPADERARVELSIDGVPVEALGDASTGELIVPLTRLRDQPGWHFIELGLQRRGGRNERIVDPVLVGDFAREDPTNKPCAASLSASPALIQSLIVPMLEREVLPALRGNEHMGPATKLSKAKLELRDDALRFELELSGVNTLAVSGVVLVGVARDRQLYAKLKLLDEVDFRGKLRNQARGGGAFIGGLITGPLAPVGAAAGWYLADRFVTKKARELVREQIQAGLAELAGIDLLPAHVELMPGRPGSRVAIGFCEQTRIRATGLSAGLWIEPDSPDELDAKFDLGVPGPLVTAAALTTEPLANHEDLRVELSIDLVNALLTEWTASGLLAELIGEQRALDRANVELEAWTPLRLGGLRPTRPPALTPTGGPTDGWGFGIGGLAVDLTGVDEQPWGEVFVAAAGSVRPTWDPEAGTLSLLGSLDRLDITCARPGATGEPRALHGCFSEVLEAVEVRERIDAHLRPGARGLPSLAVRELLAERVGVQIEALALSRPRPGVLRLSAGVLPPLE